MGGNVAVKIGRSMITTLTLLAAMAAPARADEAAPLCTATTRPCLAATARAYFAAILAGDAAWVPFADAVRVTEQNHLIATSRAGFLKEFKSTGATKRLRNMRMLIDPNRGEVAVMVLSDVEIPEQSHFTVRRIQRLKIVHGLITEVELIVLSDPTSDALWPDDRP